MDMNQSAQLSPPVELTPSPSSSRQHRQQHHHNHNNNSNMSKSSCSLDDPLPPITTDSLPTALQSQIANQSWEYVSARQPIGCPDNKPDTETFIHFASTILETRLADVVRHRREAKRTLALLGTTSASAVRRNSANSVASDEGGPMRGENENTISSALVGRDRNCDSLGGQGELSSSAEPSYSKPPVTRRASATSYGGWLLTADDGVGNSLGAQENHDSPSEEDDKCSSKSATKECHQSSSKPPVLLTSACRSQLRAYVRRVASMYRENRYHGLEHAVHVTMSANKLMDMLHEGTQESSSDDEEEAEEMNNFSVSEPHIMKPTSVYKRVSNARRPKSSSADVDKLLGNESMHSLQSLCENGFDVSSSTGSGGALGTPESSTRQSPVAPGASSSSSAARKYNFSEGDFDNTHRHLKPPHKHRSSTHLIYSDMFTKFAFVFAAIIHDVDHQGVPNTTLVKEKDPVVETHGGISAAEKQSIKVAFRTLNEGDYDEFRSVVFESPDDQLQMHRIVTNLVISTDIASPERMQSTKLRWEEAFSHPAPWRSTTFGGSGSTSSGSLMQLGRLSLAGQSPLSEIATVQASKPQLVAMQNDTSSMVVGDPRLERRNSLKRVVQLNGGVGHEYYDHNDNDTYDEDELRTALRHSVVIETMLNVADVAHSMQSWELFLFWNRKLFEELYVAYKEGRSDGDPSVGWYKNQLGFYRLYVIPLAEKMKKCGVFSTEGGGVWVRNAMLIRDRWSREGEEVTRDMIASVKRDL